MRDQRHRSRPAHFPTGILCACVSLLAALVPIGQAPAFPTHPGKWTGPMAWPGTAVNMVVLPPGATSYSARVLWWQHDATIPVLGGVWGWRPPNDSLVNGGTLPDGTHPAFPVSSFDSLGLDNPPFTNGTPTNIFCAGQTLLGDGRLLVTGGTTLIEVGTKSALLFDPSADANGQWNMADTMSFRRWYPDNALLPSGKVVTVAGSSGNSFVALGGIAGATDSTTRMLQRIVAAPGASRDSSAVPTNGSDVLAPFSDAAATEVPSSAMFVFGGKDKDGFATANAIKVTRNRAEFAPDYTFTSTVLPRDPNGFAPPSARSGAAVATLSNGDLLLIGGTSGGQEVWRARISNNAVFWHPLIPTGVSFPALHGPSAVYDPSTDRVFVFGGSSGTNGNEKPTDSTVYSLRLGTLLTSDSCIVTAATVVSGTGPGPRSYGSLSYDPDNRLGMPTDATHSHRRAFFFGGRAADSTLSNGLYELWFKSATEVVWQALTPASGPSARAHHGAVFVDDAQWLMLSGGETSPSTASNERWAYDVGSNHWEPLPPLALAVRGHAAVQLASEPEVPRVPEVFDPVSQSWTSLSNALHWQEWYSFGFAAPRTAAGDFRVFYAGPESPSSILKVSGTPSWTTVPSTAGNFLAGSAVMYRPGKVMKCGTRDTGGTDPASVVGRTSVIDLAADTSTWAEAAPADQMISRRNHNLVVLPSGEVLVVGGARYGKNDESTDANCVRMPQIWNPDTLAAGHWYGQDGMRFDSSTVRRHYHATAVLLPDARVLVAGGNADSTQQMLADIYSPYYLFNSDRSPRTRPVIQGAPAQVAYGERFSLSMGPNDQLSKVILIRPGSTTHAFDQNQRYVPLNNWSVVNPRNGINEQRFLVSAPADSFEALPGDYMLFALNTAGTPAIAKWIKLRATNTDAAHPSPVINLTKDCSTDATQANLKWSPPCADSVGSGPCPGPAALYDIRYRAGSPTITSANFDTSPQVSGEPPPDDPVAGPGQTLVQGMTVSGLTANTTYTFAMKSKNYSWGNGNWSLLSNVLTLTTHAESCGGSGGGGGCCQEGGLVSLRASGTFSLQPDAAVNATGSTFLENTLLANVPPGVSATDLLGLRYGPKWTESGGRVRLSQSGTLGTHFSSVRLLAVSQTPGEELFVAGDQVLSGTLTDPVRVTRTGGRDLTALFAADSSFDGRDGDTLLVEFNDPTPARIALKTSRSQLVVAPDRTGIDIQCQTAQGWQTVAHHDPRELLSSALYDVPSPGKLRLIFLGEHRLHGVSRFVPGASPTVTSYEPASVVHSRYGDLTGTLVQAGASLAAGDTMLADFAVTRDQSAGAAWFLEVKGEHTATAKSTSAAMRPVSGGAEPLKFALEQNRPNPFDSRTEIGFELPVRSAVKLEVFDLLGRRVATLANATYEPGRYSVSWDRRGNRGTRVPAGVYTCRYTAAARQEQRRMVVFP